MQVIIKHALFPAYFIISFFLPAEVFASHCGIDAMYYHVNVGAVSSKYLQ